MAEAGRPLVESGRSGARRETHGCGRQGEGGLMTLLTEATDVFAATTGGRAAVVFLASYVGDTNIFTPAHARAVDDVLVALSREGWHLSVAAMIDDQAESEPAAFATGF